MAWATMHLARPPAANNIVRAGKENRPHYLGVLNVSIGVFCQVVVLPSTLSFSLSLSVCVCRFDPFNVRLSTHIINIHNGGLCARSQSERTTTTSSTGGLCWVHVGNGWTRR